jgi:hypothetical protein
MIAGTVKATTLPDTLVIGGGGLRGLHGLGAVAHLKSVGALADSAGATRSVTSPAPLVATGAGAGGAPLA